MARINRFICDRCGNDIEETQPQAIFLKDYTKYGYAVPKKFKDLCGKCYQSLVDWMEHD